MTQAGFKALLVQTLFAPRRAAEGLIALNLPQRWLWTALALMSVLNSIVYSVSLRLTPTSDPMATAMMPPAFHSPVLFTMFLFGALAITVLALYWIGKGLGGQGRMDDVLVLICWLQVLRLILQVVVAVLVIVAPVLGALVIFTASLWGIYILIGFVDAAHRFGNMFKAAGVIVLAMVAMVVGLSILLSIIGVAVMGGA
ncbi:Yip1 domain-containing protein [Roseovarius lutimaris]|uniref:Yip1 domain-containing protein n=1 Tax=Roseovarius lutimaris TaxID=1005928 RepID=A0A1I4YG78_9RHOB|nr:Yip1 family protein [Roseovarius lutimaris]SFN37061.1 Yip1 domain-containing protein [Roseovarius lutimaris]